MISIATARICGIVLMLPPIAYKAPSYEITDCTGTGKTFTIDYVEEALYNIFKQKKKIIFIFCFRQHFKKVLAIGDGGLLLCLCQVLVNAAGIKS